MGADIGVLFGLHRIDDSGDLCDLLRRESPSRNEEPVGVELVDLLGGNAAGSRPFGVPPFEVLVQRMEAWREHRAAYPRAAPEANRSLHMHRDVLAAEHRWLDDELIKSIQEVAHLKMFGRQLRASVALLRAGRLDALAL